MAYERKYTVPRELYLRGRDWCSDIWEDRVSLRTEIEEEILICQKDIEYLRDVLDDLVEKREVLIEKEKEQQKKVCSEAIARFKQQEVALIQERDDLAVYMEALAAELKEDRESYADLVKAKNDWDIEKKGFLELIATEEKELKARKAELERKRRAFIEWEIEQEKQLAGRERVIKEKIDRKNSRMPTSNGRKIEL
jgi:hypothetical protein